MSTRFSTVLAAWAHADPARPAIHYFDCTLTVGELDDSANGFAAALADRGVRFGDRVALYLQNVPQFVIAALAVWRLGAIVVPVNPMYKERELHHVLADSGAVALVCLQSLYEIAEPAIKDTSVSTVVTTNESEGADELLSLVQAHEGAPPPRVAVGPDDTALLTYTSGTTGPPKGAIGLHRNVVAGAQTYRDWVSLGPDDVILGVAPLFHITGLIGHVALALYVPCPLVLTYRFDPGVTAEAVAAHGVTFTIGAITVFSALLNSDDVRPELLATMTKIYSGGAPIAPSTVERFRERFGHYIHNIYGLTETSSPAIGVPFGASAPVDPTSGALSIGVPVYDTVVRVIDDNGAPVGTGEIGELVVDGPQVVPGYWNNPEETAAALPDGAMRTGDVGYVDADGWCYLVDRKKDQINAAGYKVWPREVEDVLYEHPAVREAAVVGIADDYRTETVKAFVSLRPGETASTDELIAFCRDRLAAYKYPRLMELVDELPKTATGKILRREVRNRD